MPDVTEVIVNNADDGYAEEVFYYGSYDSGSFSNSTARVYLKWNTSSDPSMEYETRNSFFRFQTVPIPVGATISSAYLKLRFHSGSDYSGQTLTVKGNNVDDATSPTSVTEFRALALTTAGVDWTVGSMSSGTQYTSPDIGSVISEIVGRAGWAENNDLQLVLNAPTDGTSASDGFLLQFRSRNYSSAQAPELVISYSEATTTTAAPASDDDAVYDSVIKAVQPAAFSLIDTSKEGNR